MLRIFLIGLLAAAPAMAQEREEPLPRQLPSPPGSVMTAERLGTILLEIDPEARLSPAGVEMAVEGVSVLVVMAPGQNRMRVVVPVVEVEALEDGALLRMMQANFDTALDARYAVAQGRVWAVYLHPLAELDRRQVISGISQAVTLAQTYGSSYSSGGVMFGQGDSGGLLADLLDGEEI